jgi:hypothetical protein
MIEMLTAENVTHFDQIAVHYFIQYHAHKQLREASKYNTLHLEREREREREREKEKEKEKERKKERKSERKR